MIDVELRREVLGVDDVLGLAARPLSQVKSPQANGSRRRRLLRGQRGGERCGCRVAAVLLLASRAAARSSDALACSSARSAISTVGSSARTTPLPARTVALTSTTHATVRFRHDRGSFAKVLRRVSTRRASGEGMQVGRGFRAPTRAATLQRATVTSPETLHASAEASSRSSSCRGDVADRTARPSARCARRAPSARCR